MSKRRESNIKRSKVSYFLSTHCSLARSPFQDFVQDGMMFTPSAIVITVLSALTHPYGLLAVQLSAFGAAAFTKPTSSLRYAAIVVMVAAAYYFHLTVHDRMANKMTKTLPAGITMGCTLSAIEKLLIGKWSYEIGGPEADRKKNNINGSVNSKKMDHPSPKEPARSKFWFACDMLFSPRSVGKPWQVKNVPRFSSNDPSYVPSRGAFLLRISALAVLCFLVHDISAAQPPPDPRLIAANQEYFFSRLSDVTSEKLVFRIASTIGLWVNVAAYLSLFTYVCALLSVASGLGKPADWHPNFDSPTNAYSVRQFWGLAVHICVLIERVLANVLRSVFWHQNLRAMVEGISHFVTHDVLRLAKRTIVARYSNIFLAFFLSGLIHITSDHGMTLLPSESGAIRFFLTQALGIVLEDAFQAAYYYVSGQKRSAKAPLMHKIVGYVWLVIFLAWSTPAWSYPQFRSIRSGVDTLFPFTIFGHDIRSKAR